MGPGGIHCRLSLRQQRCEGLMEEGSVTQAEGRVSSWQMSIGQLFYINCLAFNFIMQPSKVIWHKTVTHLFTFFLALYRFYSFYSEERAS